MANASSRLCYRVIIAENSRFIETVPCRKSPHGIHPRMLVGSAELLPKPSIETVSSLKQCDYREIADKSGRVLSSHAGLSRRKKSEGQ
jgi:hypothetical protein